MAILRKKFRELLSIKGGTTDENTDALKTELTALRQKNALYELQLKEKDEEVATMERRLSRLGPVDPEKMAVMEKANNDMRLELTELKIAN